MSKIKNPEIEVKKTPKKFSSESNLISIDKGEVRRGIILDSPEEFANALIIYNGGGLVEGARTTQNKLMDDLGDKGQGMAAPILLMGGLLNSEGFTEELVRYSLSALKSQGIFQRHFDYDAFGTNFFKTTVEGQIVDGKYILKLNAAYIGTKPEERLAESLERERALICSKSIGNLSIVDDWWFNVNLEKVLQGLPIAKKHFKGLTEYIASGGYSGKRPEIIFENEGQKFSLDVNLEINKYLRPEGNEHGSEYIGLRGKNIVGGAWTNWDSNGKCEPKPVNPPIVLSVYLLGKNGSTHISVTPEQVEKVNGARDYLASLVQLKV